MNKVHYLKIKPCYLEDIVNGLKTFEIRKNDRDFQVGDILYLMEVNEVGSLTLRGKVVEVTYILKDCPQYGLKDGYVIMGIR